MMPVLERLLGHHQKLKFKVYETLMQKEGVT